MKSKLLRGLATLLAAIIVISTVGRDYTVAYAEDIDEVIETVIDESPVVYDDDIVDSTNASRKTHWVTWVAEGYFDRYTEVSHEKNAVAPNYYDWLWHPDKNPMKRGYVFVGWSHKENGPVVDLNAPNEEITRDGIVFYAVFKKAAETYTVNWSVNGEIAETDTEVAENSVPSFDGSTPTKEDADFLGWSTTEGGTVVDLSTEVVTSDVTYYAVFKDYVFYTVNWSINGEIAETDEKVLEETAPSFEGNTPFKADADFIGWSTTEGGAVVDLSTETVTSDVTYYAVFKDYVFYTVTFYADGKVYETDERVKEGTKPSVTDPTKKYTTFAGWATTPEAHTYVSTADLPVATGNATYYAIFVADAYYYFLLDGKDKSSTNKRDYMYAGRGQVVVPDGFALDQSRRYGDYSRYIITGPAQTDVERGVKKVYGDIPSSDYTLTWNTLTSAAPSVDFDYNTITNDYAIHIDGVITVVKAGVTYKVTKPDGSVSENTKIHRKGEIVSLTASNAPSFVNDGITYEGTVAYGDKKYEFDGWYSDAGCTEKSSSNFTVSEAVTYYGQYKVVETKKNVTVNYKYEDGSKAAESVSGKYFTGEEYSFTSPSIEGYLPDLAAPKGTMADENVTITVTYTPIDTVISYSVKDGNGDTTIIKKNHKFDSVFSLNGTVSTTEDFVTDGETYKAISIIGDNKYKFDGWYTDENFTTKATAAYKVQGDATFYAKYDFIESAKTVTIHYVYEDETTAGEDVTAKYFKGDEYNFVTPDIEGYTADPLFVTGTMGTSNVVKTVTYKANIYTVSYSVVGLDGLSSASVGVGHAYNTDVDVNATVDLSAGSFVTDGKTYDVIKIKDKIYKYQFDGWYVDADYNEKAPATVTVKGDVTYYAKYTLIETAKKLTVIGQREFEEPFMTIEETYFEGETRDVAIGNITGYTVKLSSDQLSNDELQVVNGKLHIVMGKEDIVVKAFYEANPYALTINYYVEDPAEDDITYKLLDTYNDEIKFNQTFKVDSLTEEDNEILKFYLAPDKVVVRGTMKNVEGMTFDVYYNLKSFTITYNNEDGTEFDKQTVKALKKVAIDLQGPGKARTKATVYTFAGWYEKEDAPASISPLAVKRAADLFTLVTEIASLEKDTVLYPAYDETDRMYTVKFVDYDGTVLKTQIVKYEGSAVAPADPSRPNVSTANGWISYTFIGWDKDFSKILGDTTVTAVYSDENNTVPDEPLTPPEGPTPVNPPVGPNPPVPPAGPETPAAPETPDEPVAPEIVEIEAEATALAPTIVTEESDEKFVEIEDEETPLAAADHCFIHWIALLTTLIYGLYASIRALTMKKEDEEAKTAEN
ncbi:MAG: InlB B-repeat-containing protein [Lachnospiraceae bacterium]|nr:InlB B-repeat-containing protein [Lachnospiraceae bacterium]